MATNLVIGLGGTGAKIIESFIHLCASGLGPDECFIGFVDQDGANGNSARTHRTLKAYIDTHKTLHDQNSAHKLVGDEKVIFKTRMLPLQTTNRDIAEETGEVALKACHWEPHNGNATLASLIGLSGMTQDAANVARLFFAAGDEELTMGLGEGYRGRPHLGSAALLADLEGSDWGKNLDDIIERGRGSDVNIFLCGSAFGGTGAAALPTLAGYIRRIASEKGATRVAVSACLALPYFSFADASDVTANVAKASYLPQQTKAALDFYRRMMEDEKDGEQTYSDIFLLGWEPVFRIGYHADGANDQCNPPLAPELIAGLAISQTLCAPSREPHANRVNVMSRADSVSLGWTDLPEHIERENVRDRISSYLRFSLLFHDGFYNKIDGQNKLGRLRPKEAWFKEHFGRSLKDDPSGLTAINTVEAFTKMHLKHMAMMAAYSNDLSANRDMFRLWDPFSIGEVNTADPRGDLQEKGDLNNRTSDFDNLIILANRNETSPDDYETVTQALVDINSDIIGPGAFLTALYAVARTDKPEAET